MATSHIDQPLKPSRSVYNVQNEASRATRQARRCSAIPAELTPARADRVDSRRRSVDVGVLAAGTRPRAIARPAHHSGSDVDTHDDRDRYLDQHGRRGSKRPRQDYDDRMSRTAVHSQEHVMTRGSISREASSQGREALYVSLLQSRFCYV